MNKSSLLSVMLMLFLSCFLIAQDGILDLTFGDNGIVNTDVNKSNDVANDVLVQGDGKILVTGFTSNGIKDFFCLMRHHQDGSLDTEFGENGIVITEFASTSISATMALQDDGKIILGGHTWGGTANEFAIARYLNDGSIDTGFGNMGMVTTLFPGKNAIGRSLAIQADGKIVMGGRVYTFDNDADDFALARYHSNGSLDQSFGFSGIVITSLTDFSMDWLNDLKIQSDGKIVAAGFSDALFAVVRYDEDGIRDPDFGNEGIVMTNLTGSEHGVLAAVRLQTDGKILGAGFIRDSFSDFALVRYETNGNLDTSFGVDGVVRTTISIESDGIEDVEIQEDDKIVVGGTSFMEGHHQFKLARYTPEGNLDPSFGQNGITPNDPNELNNQMSAIALQADGKILACGFSSVFPYDFVLGRYTSRVVATENIAGFPGQVNLYPNPTQDFIHLDYNLNQAYDVSIRLLSVEGEILRNIVVPARKQVGKHQEVISLSELAEGTYVLTIEMDREVFSYKIMR